MVTIYVEKSLLAPFCLIHIRASLLTCTNGVRLLTDWDSIREMDCVVRAQTLKFALRTQPILLHTSLQSSMQIDCSCNGCGPIQIGSSFLHMVWERYSSGDSSQIARSK